MRYLWQQFNQTSILVKSLVLGMLFVWTIAIAAMVGLIIFASERSVVAQPPVDSPVDIIPAIRLDPAAGPVNTTVTVFGEGWQPESTVFIYLTSPYSLEANVTDFAQASVVVDSTGQFAVTLPIPASTVWPAPGLVRVLARAEESEVGAQTFFSLLDQSVEPTVTVTNTVTATPILTATVTAEPTATSTPEPEAARLVANTDLNVRSGPGTSYTILGLLKADQTAEITGLSPDGRWWQINFPGAVGGRGWVAEQYTSAENAANVPIVQTQPLPAQPTPAPQPTATPVVISEWRGEYYNNPNMSGDPVVIRNDSSINFNWGTGAPAAGIGPDNFSVRWSRTINFAAGTYRFKATVDDGVLLWLDDKLIIDQWHDSSTTTYAADIYLTDGLHTVKMAYYERGSDAVAQLTWESITNYPDWKGEYYNNAGLSGSPVLVRNDSSVNFNWGSSAPAAGVPADNFSVRWSRKASFSAGTYRFSVTVDDGVRLWIDGRLVIDQWRETAPTTYSVDVNMAEGSHDLKVEYFDRWYDAQIQLSWNRVDSYPDWKAEYFNNRKLQGSPVLVRNDKKIDFDWGKNSPGGGVDSDDFSARWTRKVDFDGGTYLFKVKVDNGVRLWLDDKLLIDSWQNDDYRQLEARQKVSDGKHRVEVEYFERSGDAKIKVSWDEVDDEPANQAPQPVLNGPYTVNEGSPLTIDGRNSYDPDGNIIRYEWDFDYDGSNFNVDASTPTVSIPYPDGPTTKVVALRVTDNNNASRIATANVTVQNVAPTANAGGPYSINLGDIIGFVGRGTDPSQIDQASLNYLWDFGDGNQGQGPNASHSYAAVGTYSVQLTVTDKDGAQASSSATVTVIAAANQAPKAVITGNTNGTTGQTLNFDGSGSTDSDGTIVSFVWNFGDGATDSGADVSHSYSASGSYTVKLTVTDNTNLTNMATHQVQIDEPIQIQIPPEAIISGASTGVVGQPVVFDASSSTDTDGTIVSYEWDYGDATAAVGAQTVHNYQTAGSYTVTLTVTDDQSLSNSAVQVVTISDSGANNAPESNERVIGEGVN